MRHLATLSLLAIFCSEAHATSGSHWLYAGLLSVGETPHPGVGPLEASIARALRKAAPAQVHAHRLWPSTGRLSQAQRNGVEEGLKLLDEGLAHYLRLEMKKADQILGQAHKRLDAVSPYLPHLGPWVRCSLYLALVRRSLGQSRAATTLLRAVARRVPVDKIELTEFPPVLRTQLLRIAKSERADLTIKLQSTPPGALAILDGRLVGRTPVEVPVHLGPHGLRLEKDGHGLLTTMFEVRAGEPTNPTFTLGPKTVDDLGADSLRTGPPEEALKVARRWLMAAKARALVVGWVQPVGVERFSLKLARYTASEPPAIRHFEGRWDRGTERAGAWISDLLQPTRPEVLPLVGRTGAGNTSRWRLTLAMGAGAGQANDVSDPGIALVPVVANVQLGVPIGGNAEVSFWIRTQPLNMEHSLLMPALSSQHSWGGAGVGIPLGTIAHSIVDTETGNLDAAGPWGLGAWVGGRTPLTASLSLEFQLLMLMLQPDPTIHVDALVGIRTGH